MAILLCLGFTSKTMETKKVNHEKVFLSFSPSFLLPPPHQQPPQQLNSSVFNQPIKVMLPPLPSKVVIKPLERLISIFILLINELFCR